MGVWGKRCGITLEWMNMLWCAYSQAVIVTTQPHYTSHSQRAFHEQIYMKCSLLIYYIKSSRVASKICLWSEPGTISLLSMVKQEPMRLQMMQIDGALSEFCYNLESHNKFNSSLSLVPVFPGIQRFPHGRLFKQWMGDDSKALMKIFLPAVSEYLPDDMMKCLSLYLNFCYLVCRLDIDKNSLKAIESAVETFHLFWNSFISTGVCEHFSIPHMQTLTHYHLLITKFGSPNGLNSSITESRHITAVKKPWQWSNRYHALSQMLLTNQHLDKLSALCSHLVDQKLLLSARPPVPDPFESGSEDVGPIDSGQALADVKLAKSTLR